MKIVMLDILGDRMPQRSLTKEDHAVEKLIFDGDLLPSDYFYDPAGRLSLVVDPMGNGYNMLGETTITVGNWAGSDIMGPVDRPQDWVKLVNTPMTAKELGPLAVSLKRCRPFGGEAWTAKVVEKLQLEHTLRGEGRPKQVVS